jgi:hypothetical protein
MGWGRGRVEVVSTSNITLTIINMYNSRVVIKYIATFKIISLLNV